MARKLVGSGIKSAHEANTMTCTITISRRSSTSRSRSIGTKGTFAAVVTPCTCCSALHVVVAIAAGLNASIPFYSTGVQSSAEE